MSDPQKEKEIAQNTQRVCLNLLVLLDIGLFPGKHTLGLEECKGMVQAIMADAAQKVSALVPPLPKAPEIVPPPAPATPPPAAA